MKGCFPTFVWVNIRCVGAELLIAQGAVVIAKTGRGQTALRIARYDVVRRTVI